MTSTINGLAERHLFEQIYSNQLGLGETSVRNEINETADTLALGRSARIDAQTIRWCAEENHRRAVAT